MFSLRSPTCLVSSLCTRVRTFLDRFFGHRNQITALLFLAFCSNVPESPRPCFSPLFSNYPRWSVLFRVFRSATPPHLCSLSLATCIEGDHCCKRSLTHLGGRFSWALSDDLGLGSYDRNLLERSIGRRKVEHHPIGLEIRASGKIRG